MTLSIYNSIWLPYEQVFYEQEICKIEMKSMDILNYFIDMLFAFDIILNFNTTFQDSKTGDEKSSRPEIARNYLQGMFLIDVLATVPFYELFCLIMEEYMTRQI